jgi:AcrR family transcriptional regulator
MSTGHRGARDPGEAGEARRAARNSYRSGYDVLWGLTEPPAPRRGTGLDRDTIVQAAIEIADADGIEAVTMRRVADRLNTGPMSLYRYVPDKDALVSMMVDAVIGDVPLKSVDVPADWREGLRLLAESAWRVSRAHRWYPEASIARPPLTPNGVAGLELGLSIFDGYDIGIGTKAQFVAAVHISVLSAAMNLAVGERTRARMDMPGEDIMTADVPFLRTMMSSGRYPRVIKFLTEAERPDGEAQMWAGVELILDGIEKRLH